MLYDSFFQSAFVMLSVKGQRRNGDNVSGKMLSQCYIQLHWLFFLYLVFEPQIFQQITNSVRTEL